MIGAAIAFIKAMKAMKAMKESKEQNQAIAGAAPGSTLAKQEPTNLTAQAARSAASVVGGPTVSSEIGSTPGLSTVYSVQNFGPDLVNKGLTSASGGYLGDIEGAGPRERMLRTTATPENPVPNRLGQHVGAMMDSKAQMMKAKPDDEEMDLPEDTTAISTDPIKRKRMTLFNPYE